SSWRTREVRVLIEWLSVVGAVDLPLKATGEGMPCAHGHPEGLLPCAVGFDRRVRHFEHRLRMMLHRQAVDRVGADDGTAGVLVDEDEVLAGPSVARSDDQRSRETAGQDEMAARIDSPLRNGF